MVSRLCGKTEVEFRISERAAKLFLPGHGQRQRMDRLAALPADAVV